jgi:hypothetical protein
VSWSKQQRPSAPRLLPINLQQLPGHVSAERSRFG